MPSGAKKRKQAKKKKEQQAHVNSSSPSDTHSQGNDDPRSQDERDSDGGELGSPASQAHQNQSSFATEDSALGVEGANVEESRNTLVVEIQREESLDKAIESVDVKSSSSSSSSDDESRAFDEKQKVVEEAKEDSTIEKPLSKANGSSVKEVAPAMEWEIPVMPLSEVAKQAAEGAEFDNVEVIDVVESEFKENEDKLLPKSDVEVLPILNQNVESSTVDSASGLIRNEDNLPKSSNSQTSYAENENSSETGKDIKKARDFEASENIDTKPIVPPVPQIAQRTSFLSCCGLFDVLTGSNR